MRDNDLFKKYNGIQKKSKQQHQKEFDSSPAYNARYLKTKIKSYK